MPRVSREHAVGKLEDGVPSSAPRPYLSRRDARGPRAAREKGEPTPVQPAPSAHPPDRNRSTLPASGGLLVPCVVAAAVALVLRIVVLAQMRETNPMLRVEVLDDRIYLEMARRMADGRSDPWFLAPLHPWLVAQAGRFATIDLGLACGVNAVLGAFTSAASAAAGGLLHSRAAAWTAGLAHATLGAFVFNDVLPGQEAALPLLHVVGVIVAIRLESADGPRRAALAGALGLVAGVAMMGRASSVAILAGAIPALLRVPWRTRAAVAACAAAGVCAVLVPASIRNVTVQGGPSPFQWGSGNTLYVGNGPFARATGSQGAMELGADPQEIERNAVVTAERAEGRRLTPSEVSAWWTRKTWRERGTWGEVAFHFLRKAALFWSAEEEPCNHWAIGERRYATWLRISPVHAWWLLALGAGGWWLLRRDRPADAFALVVVGAWMLLAIVFPLSRYRMPAVALAAIVASAAVVEVARRRAPGRRLVQSAALAGAVAAVAFLPVRDAFPGIGHVNLASAHWELGDDPRVVRDELHRAIEAEPGCGPAYEVLGRLAAATGDPRGGLVHLERAALDARSEWRARVTMLTVLLDLGRAADAEALAIELLATGIEDADLLANASMVAHARGDPEEARRRLDRAAAIDPARPSVTHAAAVIRGGGAPARDDRR